MGLGEEGFDVALIEPQASGEAVKWDPTKENTPFQQWSVFFLPCYSSRMKDSRIELIGWYGACAVLAAYGLSNFGVIPTTSMLYQLLNLTGSFGIIVVSLKKKAYQPIALNIVWMFIALVAILSNL